MTTTTKATEAAAVYLVLEGQEVGAPEGPGFRAAVEAMNAVGSTLGGALARTGHPSTVGKIQKLVTMHLNDDVVPSWHFTLLVRVPSAVSTTVVEFVKHLTRTSLPIAVQRVQRIPRSKTVRPRRVAEQSAA